MYTFVRLLISLMLLRNRLLYKMKIEGLENIPPRGPYLLSANEISYVGAESTTCVIAHLILSGRIQTPVGFGDEWNWTQFWRRLYDKAGARPLFPHGRGQGAPGLMIALEGLRAGKIVTMNPEAEMSWDGRLVPPKRGVAWVALRSGAPIVLVVATQGAYDIRPKWAERPHMTGRFSVRVGRPFRVCDAPCPKVSDEMVEKANQRIAEEMAALIYR